MELANANSQRYREEKLGAPAQDTKPAWPPRYPVLNATALVMGGLGVLSVIAGFILMLIGIVAIRGGAETAMINLITLPIGFSLLLAGVGVLYFAQLLNLALDARRDIWYMRRALQEALRRSQPRHSQPRE